MRIGRDKFEGIDRLEATVSAELGPDVSWEIRGDEAVLRGSGAWGLRLEVIPREAGRVAIRLEGDLTPAELAALLRRLPVSTASSASSADGGADVVGRRHAGRGA
jgi:hypothetical protein